MIGRIAGALEDPDYNYVIHSGPARESEADFRWHLQIVPRTAPLGGLEIGCGMRIHSQLPEDAARRLREAEPES